MREFAVIILILHYCEATRRFIIPAVPPFIFRELKNIKGLFVDSTASIKNPRPSPLMKGAGGLSLKSLTSKLAGAVLNLPGSACPSGPHHFIHDPVAQAKVKHSKGNFSTVLLLMNCGDVSHRGGGIFLANASLRLADILIQTRLRQDGVTITEETRQIQVATPLFFC